MLNTLIRSAIPILAASTLFLWVPLYELYLSFNDINFSAGGFFIFSLLVSLLAGCVFTAISEILVALRLRQLSNGLFYFITFWASISGFLLPLVKAAGMTAPEDLDIDYTNLVIVSMASLVLTLLTYTNLKSAVHVFLLVLLVASVGSAAPKLYRESASVERFSGLSKSDNVIVLSFDGLAGVVAKQVIEEDPKLKNAFKDFIFYENAVSLAPATVASIRSELYGNINFRELSETSTELPEKLSDRTNSIKRENLAATDVMTYGAYSAFSEDPQDNVIPGTLIKSDFQEKVATALNFYPHIAARIGTPFLAGFINDEIRPLQGKYFSSLKIERPLVHKGSSWDALNTLQSDDLVELIQSLHATDAPRSIRYMHFLHTHFPVDFDENCTYRSDDAAWSSSNQNLQGLINETHCALQQTADYIEKLKSLGIYDKTLFIVKSDHGALASYFDTAPDGNRINNNKLWGYNRYRPLLMIKSRARDSVSTTYSSELVSLSDLAKTLCLEAPGKLGCGEYQGIDLLSTVVQDSSAPLYLDIVKDENSTFQYDSQMTVAIARESDFVSALENTGKVSFNPPFYVQRVGDLASIHAALEAYHRANGTYPVSQSYDGVHSNWGRSAEDWIPGLVPTFIKTLPRDPELSEDGDLQYLYRSDGTDYKLIAHHSLGSCATAKKLAPYLIDPVRDCWGFGYWTEGAQGW